MLRGQIATSKSTRSALAAPPSVRSNLGQSCIASGFSLGHEIYGTDLNQRRYESDVVRGRRRAGIEKAALQMRRPAARLRTKANSIEAALRGDCRDRGETFWICRGRMSRHGRLVPAIPRLALLLQEKTVPVTSLATNSSNTALTFGTLHGPRPD